MSNARNNKNKHIEEIGHKWYLALVWNITPPPRTGGLSKDDWEKLRLEQLKTITTHIMECTGFDFNRSFAILRKSKDFGAALIRHNIFEICERTKVYLESKGLQCLMFPS